MSEGKTPRCTDKIGRIRSIDPIQKILLDWGRKNFDPFPWRSTDNSFHALMAEMMLQRTKAEQVEPIYVAFTSRYETPSDAVSENPERIILLLQPLGLNWRIRKIVECIHAIDELGGQIPENLNELLKLPGIGLYAASSFLSFHSKVRASIVDSNVVRLYGRLFGLITDAETRRKKWFLEIADKMTPNNEFQQYNYAMLDLTRKICTKVPLCGDCPLDEYCEYYKTTTLSTEPSTFV